MNGDNTRPAPRANTPETLEKELQDTLGRASVPGLSEDFEARLAARIAAAEPTPNPRGARDWLRHVVPLYWVLATAAAHWIISETEWAGVPQATVWYLVVGAVSLLIPSVIVARQARAGW